MKRIIFSLLGLICLASHALASSEKLESYQDRPDILLVKPEAHQEDLATRWGDLKWAHLEAVAQVIEMYPEHEIYFLARDSELLYDFAKLSLQKDPKALKRIHLLNVSRANMRAEHIKDYLEQEGITEAKLLSGKKILFVDTGFAGTIPDVISSYYSSSARRHLQTHLLSSSNESHPSTRVFLGYLNPAVTEMAPSALHGAIVEYEHLPRYTDRSSQFKKFKSLWEPMSTKGNQSDGSVDKNIALKYQQDLAYFWNQLETQQVFNNRRSLYRGIQESLKDPVKLKENVTRLWEGKNSAADYDYVMLDLDDTLLKEVSVEFKNHPDVQKLVYQPSADRLERYQKRLSEPMTLGPMATEQVNHEKVIHYEINGTIFQSFVAIRPSLTDALLKIAHLVKEGKLRVFITSANDPARTEAVWQQLRLGGQTLQELGFEYVSPEYFLDEKGQKDISSLRAQLNLDQNKKLIVVDDLAEKIVGQSPNDFVLQVPAFGKKEVEALINSPNDQSVLKFNQKDQNFFKRFEGSKEEATGSQILREPEWLRTALIRDLIEIGTKNLGAVSMIDLAQTLGMPSEQGAQVDNKLVLKSKYPQFADILEDPETKIPELFAQKDYTKIASILDMTSDEEIGRIVLDYLWKPHAVHLEEASILRLLMKTGLYDYWIAIYVLSQPHWKDHPELVLELIKAGKSDSEIARYVLSRSHWKDYPEFVLELIKAGKLDSEIAQYVLSQPHWKDHPEFVLELIKAGKANHKIAQYVLSQPHWKDHPELVLELIKAGKFGIDIAVEVLSQPHWKDHPELVLELIKVGRFDTEIAQYVLSQPHWKDHPELVLELIKAGRSDSWIARHVLSGFHWKDHPELVLELIKDGKDGSTIAHHVLSQSHWKNHPALLAILDGKAMTVENLRSGIMQAKASASGKSEKSSCSLPFIKVQ